MRSQLNATREGYAWTRRGHLSGRRLQPAWKRTGSGTHEGTPEPQKEVQVLDDFAAIVQRPRRQRSEVLAVNPVAGFTSGTQVVSKPPPTIRRPAPIYRDVSDSASSARARESRDPGVLNQSEGTISREGAHPLTGDDERPPGLPSPRRRCQWSVTASRTGRGSGVSSPGDGFSPLASSPGDGLPRFPGEGRNISGGAAGNHRGA
jgi:hypothetical protein